MMPYGKKSGFIVLFVLGMTLLTCRTQTDSLSTVYGDNLLQNSSFEENGKSSSAFWKIHNYPGFQFAKDAPEGGGEWSVSLPSNWAPPTVYISQTIPTPSNVRDFQFSFWANNQVTGSYGKVIGIYPDTTQTLVEVRTTAEEKWKQYVRAFQLPTPTPDSLRVELWAAPTEIARIITLYDVVALRGVE